MSHRGFGGYLGRICADQKCQREAQQGRNPHQARATSSVDGKIIVILEFGCLLHDAIGIGLFMDKFDNHACHDERLWDESREGVGLGAAE